ncbi:MAG TPA: cyclophane-containing peptide 2OG-Fe(II) oxygenase YhhC, partial [Kofleriaceae bacterium]
DARADRLGYRSVTTPDFSLAHVASTPFPHFTAPELVAPEVADAALAWLRDDAEWALRVESFYEQHELDLAAATDPRIAPLASSIFVAGVRNGLASLLPHERELELVGVSAHRLTTGQTIRIHNDDIGSEESHRLLLQLNDGWRAEQGGLLMLFSNDRPEALTEVLLPVHGSAFGFEISSRSHHAVSTIRHGSRFTVVYTFRAW